MNPFQAMKMMKRFAVNRMRRRNSLRAIQSAPWAFSVIPQGEDRYQAALYFADPKVNVYQIRQWYEPMRQLAEHVPVVVLLRNAATALEIREECPLPLYFGRTIAEIEQLLGTQEIGLVFYVNQNIRNFQMMRFNEPAHVFISHGESEKAYMWSNQLKAYDYVFSAGQAARDRLAKNMLRYDATDRTRLIGRPQIDVEHPSPVTLNPDYKTVLYAPTWEGDRPSMSYGSVSSHGVSLLTSLVSSNQYNIIFRPHPRSGINDFKYREDIESLRKLFAEESTDRSPTLVFDESSSWGWQWAVADVCVTDISAVAYDWLATGKPMLVTRPTNPEASVEDSPALQRIPALESDQSSHAPALIKNLLGVPNQELAELVEYYFGDTSPGASMGRFVQASLEVIKPKLSLS